MLGAEPAGIRPELAADAQQAGKIYHIGHVASVDFDQPDQIELRQWPAFVEALRNFGWIEGKNFVFDRRRVTTRAGVRDRAPGRASLRARVDTSEERHVE